MISRTAVTMACWFLANITGVGLLAFAEPLPLRMLGAAWVALALSLSGLVVIGGLFSLGRSDPETAS